MRRVRLYKTVERNEGGTILGTILIILFVILTGASMWFGLEGTIPFWLSLIGLFGFMICGFLVVMSGLVGETVKKKELFGEFEMEEVKND